MLGPHAGHRLETPNRARSRVLVVIVDVDFPVVRPPVIELLQRVRVRLVAGRDQRRVGCGPEVDVVRYRVTLGIGGSRPLQLRVDGPVDRLVCRRDARGWIRSAVVHRLERPHVSRSLLIVVVFCDNLPEIGSGILQARRSVPDGVGRRRQRRRIRGPEVNVVFHTAAFGVGALPGQLYVHRLPLERIGRGDRFRGRGRRMIDHLDGIFRAASDQGRDETQNDRQRVSDDRPVNGAHGAVRSERVVRREQTAVSGSACISASPAEVCARVR